MSKPNGTERYVLTGTQMREVDRIAIEEYGIPGMKLMENAGEAAFQEILALLDETAATNTDSSTVLILCGSGNNGGDGYVIARKLMETGHRVKVYSLTQPTSLKGDAKAACERFIDRGGAVTVLIDSTDSRDAVSVDSFLSVDCRTGGRFHLNCTDNDSLIEFILSQLETDINKCSLVVDALLGTGIDRTVKNLYRYVINLINSASQPVLAVDIPSGIGGNDGKVYGCAVKADVTVTFQALKTGCVTSPGREHTGRLVVADIGIPEDILCQVINTQN